MYPKKILIPIPSYGFDPTEVAIPWHILTDRGVEVVFATPNGQIAKTDTKMLLGEALSIWKPILKARQDAVDAYKRMEKSIAFIKPISYADINVDAFDGLLLPGGHDKGVKEYLESKTLQQSVVAFFNAIKPVGAICHGVVLAARSVDPATTKSVLFNYNTTSLLKSQEMLAYTMTRLWLNDYYLTYPEITVEDEVKSVLADASQFQYGLTPFLRDDMEHLNRGFTVIDRNYVSARWPGDAYNFALAFLKLLEG
jgi:putative intracellular protease/amidase